MRVLPRASGRGSQASTSRMKLPIGSKSEVRGHPGKDVLAKWQKEVEEGVTFVPRTVDPNWVSGLQELKEQSALKESMKLKLRKGGDDREQGDESDSTHDTQVSVAIHNEVVVSEETYVSQLTTYKPKAESAADEKADEKANERPADEKALEGVPAEDSKVTQSKQEDAEELEKTAQEKENKEEKKKEDDKRAEDPPKWPLRARCKFTRLDVYPHP